ncbi:MAG: sugar transferase [Anaerolineae bacterium]|jgi:lipopolysaccharide/colanic/teichoic acid biosynthesis glycosyltransferase|nr:sugar transferase [Anaerolineae bacterium]MBT6060316.1 sugar transferase [Anaerolineae bacterium]MBT6322775.1 sugar transferase [Anaerolineae bacterium]MBT6813890.1 sugar transferase [Anaerolineae bacterium]MBT7774230.1 sugar transferase [Anaerolineae bacterium]
MQNQTLICTYNAQESKPLRLIARERSSYYITKRIIDFVVALGLLVLLSPLMLLISVLIFIYSPGPIFFVQERVGAKSRPFSKYSFWKRQNFKCYKFRTMKLNADSSVHRAYVKALIENDQKEMSALQGVDTDVRKLLRDPRLIRPGKFLRKTSLDELPQLWNVLRGDMSLVGPRPAIPYEVEMYEPWYSVRLEAQPGITGLQQVMARSAVDFEKQMKLDIQYVESQSLWLDIKIILQTPFVVVSGRGAE